MKVTVPVDEELRNRHSAARLGSIASAAEGGGKASPPRVGVYLVTVASDRA